MNYYDITDSEGHKMMTISGETFMEAFISGLNADWKKCKIHGLILEGVCMDSDHFSQGEFSYAEFSGCKFTNCSFQRMKFYGTKFYNVVFNNCSFNDANLNGVEMTDCVFRECLFVDTDMTNARIVTSLFYKGRMENIRLTGASLVNTSIPIDTGSPTRMLYPDMEVIHTFGQCFSVMTGVWYKLHDNKELFEKFYSWVNKKTASDKSTRKDPPFNPCRACGGTDIHAAALRDCAAGTTTATVTCKECGCHITGEYNKVLRLWNGENQSDKKE